MTSPQDIQHKVREVLNRYLEKEGLRKTPERFMILEEVYQLDHFDSDTLFQKMIERKYRVSKATIYNTLEVLETCGLVIRHQFGENQSIYEKAFHYRQHDHLICMDCRKIFEFCDPRLQATQDLLEELYPFKIQHHAMTLYGRCQKNCKDKHRNKD
ncbi:MAG: transcriptional repressor [Microscillaceae bacterium]|nr:transcriptional repressor [Microscillaceae bacterium]